jgi:hypothetical protein
MGKPRILLIPAFSELEWRIRPQLEQWAEVASFDAPGVGEESVSREELERIASEDGYRHQELSSRILERVPQELFTRAWLGGRWEPLDVLLGNLDIPLLLVQHKGCLLYTEEGFEDAVAAFPAARSASVDEKPSVSDEFAELFRDLCRSVVATG